MKKLNIKKSFTNMNFRKGTYSAGISAIVIAIVVVINMLAGQLPENIKTIDLSNQKYYTVGKTTKNVIKKVKNDVTVYQLATKGNSDSQIKKLLNNYKSLNSKIEIKTLDPEKQPGLVTKYGASNASNNSIIVVSGDRYKLVDYNEIYQTDYSDYYSSGNTSKSFDGEGQITSAINYVTTDDLPKMYNLTGHDEQQLSSIITDAIAKQNIETAALNLLTSATVPEDCDILSIVCPTKDCSKEEADAIINYLKAGGKVMMVMSYTGTETPNFENIMAEYGLELGDGYVFETDGQHYYQTGYYVIPEVGSCDITSSLSGNMYALAPMSRAIIKKSDARDTLTVNEILTTTDKSYSDVDYGNGMTQDGNNTKASDDTDGPFSIATAVSEKVDDKESKLVVFGSYAMFTDNVVGTFSLINTDLVTNSLTWMSDKEASTVSIAAKSMDVSTNTIAASSANIWTAFTVVFIPVLVLGAGFVVWMLRRKA